MRSRRCGAARPRSFSGAAQRRDDVQVVDAGLGRHVDDLLHHELAHVGAAIGGSGKDRSSKAIVSFIPRRRSDLSGSSSSGLASRA